MFVSDGAIRGFRPESVPKRGIVCGARRGPPGRPRDGRARPQITHGSRLPRGGQTPPGLVRQVPAADGPTAPAEDRAGMDQERRYFAETRSRHVVEIDDDLVALTMSAASAARATAALPAPPASAGSDRCTGVGRRVRRRQDPQCAHNPAPARGARAGTVVQQLATLAIAAEGATEVSRLLGHEGTAARLYFGSFGDLLRPMSGEELDFTFADRNRRPPRDPVNALLSFAYALLLKDCTVACLAAGRAGPARRVPAPAALRAPGPGARLGRGVPPTDRGLRGADRCQQR